MGGTRDRTLRDSHRRAGSTALEIFQQKRRTTIRQHWRQWALVVGVVVLLGVGTIWLSGWSQIFTAVAFGFTLAIAFVGWMIGGDAALLHWGWGAVGEQQTEDVLRTLGAEWSTGHDIARQYGNWDHVVVGPPGIFLIETKRFLSGRVVVANDELRSGRMRVRGGELRGSAVGLKQALESEGLPRLYVQAVVAIWGDFPQGVVELERIAYVRGDQLTAWLERQPRKPGFATADVAAGIERLAARGTARD